MGEERLAGDHIRIDTRLLEVPEMVVEGGSVPALMGQMRLQGVSPFLRSSFASFSVNTSLLILLLWPGPKYDFLMAKLK